MPETTIATETTEAQAQAAPVAQVAQVSGETQSPQEQEKPRLYSKEEVDRIARKIRDNTRRIAQKETEARLYREFAERSERSSRPEPEPKNDAEPKRDDFDTYEDYTRALARYEARQASLEEVANRERTRGEQDRLARRERAQTAFRQQLAELIEEDEDAEALIADVRLPEAALDAIAESDFGARVALHLAKHPEEQKRIAGLTPARQAAAIGRIEASLEAQARKPRDGESKDGAEKQSSKAPEPIAPVGGRGASAESALPSDKDDIETWLRKERARMRAKRW
jgi:hypothetical protein